LYDFAFLFDNGNAPVLYNSTSSNNALSPMLALPLLANKKPLMLVADMVSFTGIIYCLHTAQHGRAFLVATPPG
jgi:hypothetical protein